MKKSLSIRRMLLLIFAVFTLLIAIQASHQAYNEWRQLIRVKSLKEATRLSDKLFIAMEKISVERDVAVALLRSPEMHMNQGLVTRLKESREETDYNMPIALDALRNYAFSELFQLQEKVLARLIVIEQLRTEIDQQLKKPLAERDATLVQRWSAEISSLVTETQDLWAGFVGHFTGIDPVVTQHMRYRHLLRIITDYTGHERAIIGRLIVENADPTPEEFSELLQAHGTIEISWKLNKMLAQQSGLYTPIASYYTDAQSHYQNLYDMIRDIFYLPNLKHAGNYPIDADLWLELTAQAADSLHALKKASVEAAWLYIENLEEEAWREITLHALFTLFVLGFCGYSFRILTRRVLSPIDRMVEALLATMRGEANVPVPVDQGDEIGKLSQVLQAFQRNMESLKMYMLALERSNKELDDFAYIASHDLKEPLRGIHNHSQFLLEDNKEKLDEESTRKLGRLVYLSQRMERLVNDLLYFSRLGRQDLAMQPTDINEVIRDIENTLDHFLEERNARIIIPAPLPNVICDETRVTELFRNLITNAVKYNDKEQKQVEVGFLPVFETQGMTYRNVFYVKDNGKGIAPEFHQEIFRIFKRLQNSRDGEEGTGVGLTFVKKIVERHSGRLWLESELGQGTTFLFTLAGD